MIDEQEFIRTLIKVLGENCQDDDIIDTLSEMGWYPEDIEVFFREMEHYER